MGAMFSKDFSRFSLGKYISGSTSFFLRKLLLSHIGPGQLPITSMIMLTFVKSLRIHSIMTRL